VKQQITRILRWTAATRRVYLECGHAYDLAASEVWKAQLFIGKRVDCAACEATPKLHTQEVKSKHDEQ